MNPVFPQRRAPAAHNSATHPAVLDIAVVYRENFNFVWRTLLRLGVESSVAEDAAQDVFLVLHRRLQDVRRPELIRAFLYGTCRRIASRVRRSAGRRQLAMDAYLACLEGDEARVRMGHAGRVELKLELEIALQRLDADKREVFVLAHLEGFTGREVARALGINANTASSRLAVARADIRGLLDESNQSRATRPTDQRLAALRHNRAARKRVLAALAPIIGISTRGAAAKGVGVGLGGGVMTSWLAPSFVASASAVTTGMLLWVAGPSHIEPAPSRASGSPAFVDAAFAPVQAMPATLAESAEVEATESIPGVSPQATTPPRPVQKQPARRRATGRSHDAATPAEPGGLRPLTAFSTLRAGELELAQSLRSARLRGDRPQQRRLAQTYQARYPGGPFENEAQRALAD